MDSVVPKPTREERARALQVAIREAQRQGITSAQDLGAAPGDMDLYDAARDAGMLGLRVYAAVAAEHTAAEDLDAIAKRYPDDPLLKTGLATIAFDGSVESQTAAMLAPYSPRGSAEGEPNLTAAELSGLVAKLDARGWQVAVEAAGDRAVRLALDAIGAVAKTAQGRKSPRHRIEGLATVASRGHSALRRARRDRLDAAAARNRRRPPHLVEEPRTGSRGARLAGAKPQRSRARTSRSAPTGRACHSIRSPASAPPCSAPSSTRRSS